MKIIISVILYIIGNFIATNKINNLSQSCNFDQQISEVQTYDQDGYIDGFEQRAEPKTQSNLINLYNMVNYNVLTHTQSFEYFDYNSYPKRSNTVQTTILSENNMVENNSLASTFLSTVEYSSCVDDSNDSSASVRNIIGEDNRVLIASPKAYPYKATALIRMTYYNVYNNEENSYKTKVYIGTGFLEGPNLMVTAGHCVYGDVTKTYTDENGVEHSEWEDNLFNPRFPDKVEAFFGCSGKSDVNAEYEYYAEASIINIDLNYYYSCSSNHDWAAIELDRNVGNMIGLWYGKICNWYEDDYDVFSWGYPGDKMSTMWETSGKTVGSSDYRLYYDFDTISGQSGSPVFMTDSNGNRYVCGIHTSGGDLANSGIKFTLFIYHYLNSYISYHNYEHLSATIAPIDYGYPDVYPTSSSVANNFKTHTLASGFQFRTKRYRTGYIHNEYIVMSSIRKNIHEAYIIYEFDTPVTKIEVSLSHWRELSHEWTSPRNCTSILRTGNSSSGYTTHLDLLASSTNLPTDRNNQATYTIVFSVPVTSFEFYMSNTRTNVNDDNRGRICIGNLNIYAEEGYY